MLAPGEFFDLAEFRHARLFAGVGAVWEALGRLSAYVSAAFGLTPEEVERREDQGRGLIEMAPGTVVHQGAMVLGPALIGPGCHLRAGSLVRGPVILGEGALVGHGSEVSASVLLNEARLAHLNYVGNSIVGSRANLGAGAICSNFKLNQQPVTVRVGAEVHETGLAKFGAVLGDDVQLGCHAVLNPGTLIGPRTWVYPGATLRGYYPGDHIIKVEQKLELVPRR